MNTILYVALFLIISSVATYLYYVWQTKQELTKFNQGERQYPIIEFKVVQQLRFKKNEALVSYLKRPINTSNFKPIIRNFKPSLSYI